jgi:oxygen-independent coproporphyrinogen-3 oxidase
VSNFARPGHRARHNVAYWRARPYLGLGPGAVSTVGRRRWRNAPGVDAYVGALVNGPATVAPAGSAPPPRHVEALTDETLARERLLLAARCGLAVPLTELAAAVDPAAVTPLAEAGLLSLHSGTIRVTRKGRYVANEVCVRLFRA